MKKYFGINVRLPRRKASLFLVLFLQLVACSLWGQVMQKKVLAVEDYAKWGKLNLKELSKNGQWVNYTMSYESGIDTLFVKNTQSMLTHRFPLGKNGHFVNPDWFIFQTSRQIHLLNLKTGKAEIVDNAVQYEYSPLMQKVLILLNENKATNTLLIRNLEGSDTNYIIGVVRFIMDPTNKRILYTSTVANQYTISLLDLSQKNKKTILHSGAAAYDNLVWHPKGKSLAFIQASNSLSNLNTIFYYDLHQEKIYNLNTENQNGFWGDSLVISNKSYQLKISDDSQKVFFSVKQKAKSEAANKTSDVQIWNGNAKWIYPIEEKRKQSETSYLALWQPFDAKQKRISSDSLPQFMLTGDQKYALLSNRKQYEPQFDYEGPRDFYLLNLSTGKMKLFLKKHSGSTLYTTASPTGKYIAYFKENNWWIYDISKQTHTNITKNINYRFYQNNKQHPDKSYINSNISWSSGDQEILLCDDYDVWAINTDGLSARRLTRGREIQTHFQFAGFSYAIPSKPNYDGMIFNSVDLNEGLMLEVSNAKGYSGYQKWSPKFSKIIISSSLSKLDQLMQSKTGHTVAYTEQRYDLSPRLMLKTHSDKTPKIIVQSNAQLEQYSWGKAELIQYKNSKGDSLSGILYYPAQYNSHKKYPMIVYIYEKLSRNYYNYINPSQLDDRGFNISTFTTQGYFVLLPDISYKIGEPGISAVDCVVSATKEIIKNENILPNKVGLIGHSFGGYETDFIVTQTNLFAAAVAGSAATDLSSFYVTIGATGRPDLWRFEHQQWRMGKSLFEDWEGYNKNSPIVHVKNITTPLLTWTGGDDKQVNWNQSTEFFVALHRLQKKHIMLLYPKEGHTLSSSKNQKDLQTRIHDWFDYHLKDLPPPSWITSGLK